jgi:hypothetical protein
MGFVCTKSMRSTIVLFPSTAYREANKVGRKYSWTRVGFISFYVYSAGGMTILVLCYALCIVYYANNVSKFDYAVIR